MAHRPRPVPALPISLTLAATAALAAALIAAPGCGRDPAKENTDGPGSTTAPTSGDASSGVTASTTTVASTGDTPPTTTEEGPKGDLPVGGECNLFAQDCGEGTKCNAWSMEGGFFPDGAKCVPVSGDKQPGEECAIEGKFGDGIDNCVAGSICLDVENAGKATCVAYCSGTMDDPECPNTGDAQCAFLFEPTVPLCFPSCDPLVQNCSPTDTCVPNIAALGAPFFVCMPRVLGNVPGQYGDVCYALSGCDPSFLCIFAENVPDCGGIYCCSTYCDLDVPGTCTAFDPTLSCIPWFAEGQATPGYEKVGVCGIMP